MDAAQFCEVNIYYEYVYITCDMIHAISVLKSLLSCLAGISKHNTQLVSNSLSVITGTVLHTHYYPDCT